MLHMSLAQQSEATRRANAWLKEHHYPLTAAPRRTYPVKMETESQVDVHSDALCLMGRANRKSSAQYLTADYPFTSYPRMLPSRWARRPSYGTICLWVTGWSLFWH